uniref:Uncharacterized protein n=1 Tax=Ditylenchus dipsaci TaxID=166011 RepID=A0A915ETY9_9BILA
MDSSIIYNDPKYQCGYCFKMHVERGAFVLAIIGVIASIISFLLFCTLLFTRLQNFYMIAVSIIAMIMYLSIIYAQKRREPWLFLPYLYYWSICLILGLLLRTLQISMMIVLPISWSKNSRRSCVTPGSTFTYTLYNSTFFLVYFIIRNFITIFLSVWIFSVIYRAYKYMKDEQSIRVAPPTLHKI